MLSQHDKETIHDILAAAWPYLWDGQRTADLCAEMGYVQSEDLLESIRRHRHDNTKTSKGEAVGAFPPTVAHLEAHLSEITAERIRKRLEADQRKRDQESHQTYQELLGQRESVSEKGKRWGVQIRLQMARAAEIRKAVEDRYGLDSREQAHQLLVMRTLGAAKYEGWEEDATEYERGSTGEVLPNLKVGLLPVDRALEVAEEIAVSMGIARQQRVAA